MLRQEATLIGVENGKRSENTAGVIRREEHIRDENGRLIVKRLSNFTWWDKEEKALPT